ncbi:helix-turn-helix domain-containing protein [Sphingomonas ginsenosidivorax]|uniref:Helix-turn-helix domain-containing protein n=1 Tax=Sphingomonas ginsenosidivorax TaxID=862135 RepID=A0A5C6UCL3_9SPHN|nr:helix-turn-helix domain-containing protein [Sphingomonas ginsenosidivorax]TXC69688.1 helix-turn-helix domain-containing protein [Sphingomonas ginsenosidivorax]
MDEVETGHPAAPAHPERAGDVLRVAREAQGLTLADVAARTRVPLRHLEAIDASDYAGLPSPTYAVGFGRAYARAIGADEVRVAQMVRDDVAKLGRRTPEYEPYTMTDPARVPSRGVAVVALGLALAVLVLVGLWYGTDWFRAGDTGGASGPATVATVPAPAVSVAVPKPVAPTGGQVTLAATDEVWMRVYDADDKTLYLGTMKPGEKYDVPAGAKDPMINVGRPDKLTVTLNGANVPPLGTGERAIKDVKVGPEAIAARLSGATVSQAEPARSPAASSGARSERNRSRPRRVLTETQRANLQSAANPPPAP